jgi:hypothetical protein
VEAIEHWHEFYVLVGTAAATLVALLFVAVSLGAGFLNQRRAAATRAFFSPVVLHFTAVFFISAAGLFPAHNMPLFAILVGGCASVGGGMSLFAAVELLRHRWTSFVQDHVAYGLLPLISYIALLIAAAMLFSEDEYALLLLAGALLTLLIVNIRNAWDLTLSMVHRQTEIEPRGNKRKR